MSLKFVLSFYISFVLCFVLCYVFIPVLKKQNASQTILDYVIEHKEKNGTPTLGGLFFTISAIITFYIFNGFKTKLSNVIIAFTVGYMSVGFLDDIIKINFKRNLGLKAYQKIFFQVSLSIIATVFCYYNGLVKFYLPYTNITLNLTKIAFFIIPFIFIATTNSVNLLDGLDGLCTSITSVYLALIFVLIYIQSKRVNFFDEGIYFSILLICICFLGSMLAFLIFNFNKASVFMGDTGSMALGGLVSSISIFTENSFYIVIFGVIYFLTSLSVIIQVISYKLTKKRVFLMSPFHHHLQQKGLSESKICVIYSLISLLVGLSAFIIYL